MLRQFIECKIKVLNRGIPPDAFLNELVDWGRIAPDEVFARNEHLDIYSNVVDELGPWVMPLQRRAAMLEVLRVLGGFESSWEWQAGVDTTNPDSNTSCTEEAGIFQCSGNSMSFDPSLKALLKKASRGMIDCETFKTETKSNHPFAIEYCARLIRFTIDHHGPIKRKEINPWLSRKALAEFEALLGRDA